MATYMKVWLLQSDMIETNPAIMMPSNHARDRIETSRHRVRTFHTPPSVSPPQRCWISKNKGSRDLDILSIFRNASDIICYSRITKLPLTKALVPAWQQSSWLYQPSCKSFLSYCAGRLCSYFLSSKIPRTFSSPCHWSSMALQLCRQQSSCPSHSPLHFMFAFLAVSSGRVPICSPPTVYLFASADVRIEIITLLFCRQCLYDPVTPFCKLFLYSSLCQPAL